MTIIQPHKNNGKTGVLIPFLVIGCVSAAVWSIFLYNQVVELRHELSNNADNLHKTEIGNAELKDNLYKLTDESYFSSSTKIQSLTLEKNPQYVKFGDN